MYIDFIDTLRNIQNGIYPQIKKWHVSIADMMDEVRRLRDLTLIIKDQVEDLKCDTAALSLDAKSWAEEKEDAIVQKHFCDHDTHIIGSAPVAKKAHSAKHWALKAKGITEEERLKAMAAQMTAWSFANEPIGVFVSIYTSNGDGTFHKETLDGIYSAFHYSKMTEKLSGQMRWVETQVATECQTDFTYQKIIGHADVYVNGVRQVEGFCYNTVLNEIQFTTPGLHDGDTVTVSGMEAITQTEFSDLAEKARESELRTKYALCEAEAARKTAESFVSAPVGESVKIYTSKKCKISVVETTMYSAYHWSQKLNEEMSSMKVIDLYSDLEHMKPSEAKVLYVRGGFKINDGRQGMFIYDHTNTCQNNGGTVINGWVRQYIGPINIHWFKIFGDGHTDATDEFEKILKLGEDIFIPKGDYVLSRPIKFDSLKVESDQARFIITMLSGRAITISNMGYNQGIFGDLTVQWNTFRKDTDKVSFFMEACNESRFDLSSDNASVGIMIDPEYGSFTGNVINLGIMKNNTVGIYFGDNFKQFNAHGNTFNYGQFTQERLIEPQWKYAADASHIFFKSNNVHGTYFNLPTLSFSRNENGEFLLFKVNGTDTRIKPLEVSYKTNKQYVALCNGNHNTLDLRLVDNLKAYVDEIPGYTSNIDTRQATDLIVLGDASLRAVLGGSQEVVTDGPKASQFIFNLGGLGSKYFTNGVVPAIGIQTVNGDKETLIGPDLLEFKDKNQASNLQIRNSGFELSKGKDKLSIHADFIHMDQDPASAVSQTRGFLINKGPMLTGIAAEGIVTTDDMTKGFTLMNDSGIEINHGVTDAKLTNDSIEFSDRTQKDLKTSLYAGALHIKNTFSDMLLDFNALLFKGKTVDDEISINANDSSWFKRNMNADYVLKLINSGIGGALHIFVPKGSPGVTITDGQHSFHELRAGNQWKLDGKKIQWTGTKAPTVGTWEVGDLVFNDEPIVNGNIGWCCVQQGTPGKWKEFGKVDFRRIPLVDDVYEMHATDGQTQFIVKNDALRGVSVYVDGVRLFLSDFSAHLTGMDTLISLNTPLTSGQIVTIAHKG